MNTIATFRVFHDKRSTWHIGSLDESRAFCGARPIFGFATSEANGQFIDSHEGFICKKCKGQANQLR